MIVSYTAALIRILVMFDVVGSMMLICAFIILCMTIPAPLKPLDCKLLYELKCQLCVFPFVPLHCCSHVPCNNNMSMLYSSIHCIISVRASESH